MQIDHRAVGVIQIERDESVLGVAMPAWLLAIHELYTSYSVRDRRMHHGEQKQPAHISPWTTAWSSALADAFHRVAPCKHTAGPGHVESSNAVQLVEVAVMGS